MAGESEWMKHPEAYAAAAAPIYAPTYNDWITIAAGRDRPPLPWPYVYLDEKNQFQVKSKPAGFEGQGAKGFDGVEAEELMEDMMKRALKRIGRDIKGLSVANAISALQSQHRSDGRPAPFIPELE